jgi:ankyrin repeat protein/predicted DNA-binding WGR domain protein
VFNGIKKQADNFAKANEEAQMSSEDSEESESEVSQIKRIKGTKQAKETSAKKGKEKIIEESMDEEDVLAPVKGRRGVKTNDGSSKKQEVVQEGKEYKKGKYNYLITEIPKIQRQFESTDDKPVFSCSVRNNDREVLRAAITGNKKLMKNLLDSKEKISTLGASWGLNHETNAFQAMCKRNDTEMLKMFLGKINDYKNRIEFANLPTVALQNIQTGYNDKYAYGVATRKVNVSRGGREGNNAFVEDLKNGSRGNNFINDIEDLIKIKELKVDTLKFITTHQQNFENELLNSLDEILIHGRTDIAEYVLKKAESNGGYGTNEYFVKALTGTKQSISAIPKQSVTKKAHGMKNVSPIHCACLNPNADALKHLLTVNPEFQNMDQRMRKPIHYAACSASVQALQYLISQNVDPKDHDNVKRTPLMYAARAGRVENVRFLIENNRSIPAAKDRQGYSAIHLAAENGHTEVIKVLIEAGVKVALGGPDRKTALHIAAARGDLEMVQFLVENNAKVTVKDKMKRSPLVLACKNGNLQVAAYLLQQGSPFVEGDSSGNTPLHYACAYGYPELIEVLMRAGANPNSVNSWNLSPTAVALLKSYFSCLRKMLDYPQTDVNCIDDEGRTLVSNSVKSPNEESLAQIIFLLKEKKANPNIQDSKGLTAFDYLCLQTPETITRRQLNGKRVPPSELQDLLKKNESLYERFLDVFLSSGIDLNHQDRQGYTCLFRALRCRNRPASIRLLQHAATDASLCAKDGTTALHCLSRLSLEPGLESLAGLLLAKLGTSAAGQLQQHAAATGTTPALELLAFFAERHHRLRRRLASCAEARVVAEVAAKAKVAKADKKAKKSKVVDEEDEDGQEDEEEENDDDDDQSRDNDEDDQDDEEEDDDDEKSKSGNVEEESEETKRARDDYEFTKMMQESENSIEREYFSFYQDLCTGRKDTGLNVADEEKLKSLEKKEYNERIQSLLQTLKLFINNGAKVDARVKNPLRKFGKRFLELDDFFSDNYFDMVRKILLRRINDKNEDQDVKLSKNCGNSLLHFGIRLLDLNVVKTLVEEFKCDINSKCAWDSTPLINLVDSVEDKKAAHVQTILEYLISRKADTHAHNMDGESALTLVIQSENQSLLRTLIDAKANLNQTNKDGVFPLLVAVKAENADLAELLLAHGASAALVDSKGRSCLHWAVDLASESTDAPNEIIPLLLAHGADVNALDIRGRTPLHYAFVKIGDPFISRHSDPIQNIVDLLQRPGVNVDVRDKWGNTPLSYAAQRGSVISTLYLLKNGANIDNVNEDGNTPLGFSLHYGHESETIFLLQKGSSVHRPIMEERFDIAKALAAEAKKAEKKKADKNKQALGKENFDRDFEWTSEESVLEESEDEDKMDEEKIDKNEDDEEEDIENDEDEEEDEDEDEDNDEPNKKKTNLQKLKKGKPTSAFSIAIRRNWQSVAFLMLEFGFDLSLAILDCFNHRKYNYVYTLLLKKADAGVYQTTNAEGQNLTHLFAQNAGRIGDDLFSKILGKLEAKQLDFGSADRSGRTSLHYAAEAGSVKLIAWLLERGLDVNKADSGNVTPLGHLLKSAFGKTVEFAQLGLAHRLDLNEHFTFEKVDHTALTYIIAEDKSMDTFIKLHELGADINKADSKGRTPLIHLIKKNKLTLIEDLASKYKFNYKSVDNTGKTVIHYVVLPNDYGSFQNVKLLKLLAKHQDVNLQDKLGRSPLSYAIENRCENLADALRKLKANEAEEASIRRVPTSLLSNMMFQEQMYNFEEDFDKFVEQCKQEADKTQTEFDYKCPVDENATGNYEVCYDGEDPYDCYMVKVDISYGYYSGNTFYKMQILRERVRDVYILFTRWGRVGTSGQFQQTPFSSLAEARKEYCSVFKSKSGNQWEDRHAFAKVDKKYRLVPPARRTRFENYVRAISYKNSRLPPSALAGPVYRAVRRLCNSHIYLAAIRRLCDCDVPVHSLTKERISDAQAVLDGISKALDHMEKARGKDKNLEELQEIAEEISKLSSEYYELMPTHKYTTEALPAISSAHSLQEEKRKLVEIGYTEVTLKLLAAAYFNRQSVNPVDYVVACLPVKVLHVGTDSLEHRVIE